MSNFREYFGELYKIKIRMLVVDILGIKVFSNSSFVISKDLDMDECRCLMSFIRLIDTILGKIL